MKANVFDVTGKKAKQIDLPKIFSQKVREDLIAKILEAKKINQPYGPSPVAGKQHSASGIIVHRRHVWKSGYGKGMSRIPRKTMLRRGTQFQQVGAEIPSTRGGRRAHPPKAEKKWSKSINDKERKKAIRSALTASINKDLVKKRGHLIPINYPFVLNNELENINKTKDVKNVFEVIGLKEDLKRVEERNIRAGRGKMRGRRYKSKKGPLIVVSKDCNLLKSAVNIPGVDVIKVNNINCELLAPGHIPGRLTIYTEDSIKKIKEGKLFI